MLLPFLLLLAAPIAVAVSSAAPTCASVKDKVVGAGHNIGPSTPSKTQGACCALCQKHGRRYTSNPLVASDFSPVQQTTGFLNSEYTREQT